MDFNKATFLPEAESYHDIASHFVPGYKSVFEIAGCHLRLNLPTAADILIVGAGGGMEIRTLSQFSLEWRFTGVDPSSRMLDFAKFWAEKSNAASRVKLIEGLVSDLPNEPAFDAATCFAVMHFLPNETEKLKLLEEIAARLKPNGILLLFDLAVPKGTDEFDTFRVLYRTHAEQYGESEEMIEKVLAVLDSAINPISGEKEGELIVNAGFAQPTMFFSSLWFKAWFSRKN